MPPPNRFDEDVRELRGQVHALQTQVALLTAFNTDAKMQIAENERECRANCEQILVIKTRIAIVASTLGAGAALATKYLLHFLS